MTAFQRRSAGRRASRGLVGRRDVNRRRMARLGWGFSAPALIIVVAVTIFPIVYSVVLSLSNVTVTGSGIKLGGSTGSNYVQVVENSTWQYALGFTIIYTIITVLVELVLGTLIALVLQRLAAGRGWMMALLLIPWSMITVINAELWRLHLRGDLRSGRSLGRPAPTSWVIRLQAIIGLMIADIWKTTPFVAIIVLSGLVMLDGTSTRRPRWTAPRVGRRSGGSPSRCCGLPWRWRCCSACCRRSGCSTCRT